MKEKVGNKQNILPFVNFDVDLLEFIYNEHIPIRPFKSIGYYLGVPKGKISWIALLRTTEVNYSCNNCFILKTRFISSQKIHWIWSNRRWSHFPQI